MSLSDRVFASLSKILEDGILLQAHCIISVMWCSQNSIILLDLYQYRLSNVHLYDEPEYVKIYNGEGEEY